MAEIASRSDVSSVRRHGLEAAGRLGDSLQAVTRSWDFGGPFRRDRAGPAADALRPKLAAILLRRPSTFATRPCRPSRPWASRMPARAWLSWPRIDDNGQYSLAGSQGPRPTGGFPSNRRRSARLDFARIPKPDRGAPRARQGRSRRGDGTDSRSARTWLASRAARGDRRFGRHAWRPG